MAAHSATLSTILPRGLDLEPSSISWATRASARGRTADVDGHVARVDHCCDPRQMRYRVTLTRKNSARTPCLVAASWPGFETADTRMLPGLRTVNDLLRAKAAHRFKVTGVGRRNDPQSSVPTHLYGIGVDIPSGTVNEHQGIIPGPRAPFFAFPGAV
jgi:hypothetical protein